MESPNHCGVAAKHGVGGAHHCARNPIPLPRRTFMLFLSRTSPPPPSCSYLPSLLLQSELARTCDIQLFDMTNTHMQQQQQPQHMQQLQLDARACLPCMLRFEMYNLCLVVIFCLFFIARDGSCIVTIIVLHFVQ